jgi:hypothetical protein
MDPEKMIEEANQTLKQYSDVLGRAAELGDTVPESLLPFPREQIKNALLVAYFCDADPQFREQLKSAYVCLAEFIPDEEARLSLEVAAAMTSNDPQQVRALGSDRVDRWRQTRNAVAANMQGLSDEFDRRVNRITQ